MDREVLFPDGSDAQPTKRKTDWTLTRTGKAFFLILALIMAWAFVQQELAGGPLHTVRVSAVTKRNGRLILKVRESRTLLATDSEIFADGTKELEALTGVEPGDTLTFKIESIPGKKEESKVTELKLIKKRGQ
jgi:hypothetical protein